MITGTQRLMERPMEPLLDLLREAGAGIQTLGENGNGPYRVTGNKIEGGRFSIKGDISSQFISALMLVAPYWEKGMRLNFTTPLVSLPYIEMTARLMERFGVTPILTDEYVEVPAGKYKEPEDFTVEADWSSASFFYEAAALGADNIQLEHLAAPEFSLQGDAVAARIFGQLGVDSTFNNEGATLTDSGKCQEMVEIDFKNSPDLMLPYAVACLMKGVNFRFTGVANLRLKESDRINSLVTEAGRLGYVVTAGDDTLEWRGERGERVAGDAVPLIKTYDDHRVAMAFAMVALKTGEIRIEHPEVVEKSFIDFWNQLEKIGLTCTQEGDVMTVKR